MKFKLKWLYKASALFLSISLALPAPAYSARALGAARSEVRNDLLKDLAPLGVPAKSEADILGVFKSARSEARQGMSRRDFLRMTPAIPAGLGLLADGAANQLKAEQKALTIQLFPDGSHRVLLDLVLLADNPGNYILEYASTVDGPRTNLLTGYIVVDGSGPVTAYFVQAADQPARFYFMRKVSELGAKPSEKDFGEPIDLKALPQESLAVEKNKGTAEKPNMVAEQVKAANLASKIAIHSNPVDSSAAVTSREAPSKPRSEVRHYDFAREKRDAEIVLNHLTTPLETHLAKPGMIERFLRGGFGQDGYGVPAGAAIHGTYAKEGTQGYFVNSGKAFFEGVKTMRDFFKKRAERIQKPIRLVIKVGIGGQHTPFQGIADLIAQNINPQDRGLVIGEYELGKDYEAAISAILKKYGWDWDQVVVIPSSKSGSTDETMMIFSQLLHLMLRKTAEASRIKPAIADVVFKVLHDINFINGEERPGKDLFNIDETRFGKQSLLALIAKQARQSGISITAEEIRGLLGKVLGNMFFETTDNPATSRLSAFIRNSGLDKELGEDAPGFGAMFDNVGGRWTGDLHMMTFLAFYANPAFDADYFKDREGYSVLGQANRKLGEELGNQILDQEITDIALVVPDEAFWLGKAIEQNFNESIWQKGFANLVAIKESQWAKQASHYAYFRNKLVINLADRAIDENLFNAEKITFSEDALSRAAAAFSIFYEMTTTVGTRLIARAIYEKGLRVEALDLNDLDNPVTKVLQENLFTLQPYVELGKKSLETKLKADQAKRLHNPDILKDRWAEVMQKAHETVLVTRANGGEQEGSLTNIIEAIQEMTALAKNSGRKFVPILYLSGDRFVDLRTYLTNLGVEWVMQGTGDQHISINQALSQPQAFLPFIISFVSDHPQPALPAIGFAKGYLDGVSPDYVRHAFAEATYNAFVKDRQKEGGVAAMLTLTESRGNIEIIKRAFETAAQKGAFNPVSRNRSEVRASEMKAHLHDWMMDGLSIRVFHKTFASHEGTSAQAKDEVHKGTIDRAAGISDHLILVQAGGERINLLLSNIDWDATKAAFFHDLEVEPGRLRESHDQESFQQLFHAHAAVSMRDTRKDWKWFEGRIDDNDYSGIFMNYDPEAGVITFFGKHGASEEPQLFLRGLSSFNPRATLHEMTTSVPLPFREAYQVLARRRSEVRTNTVRREDVESGTLGTNVQHPTSNILRSTRSELRTEENLKQVLNAAANAARSALKRSTRSQDQEILRRTVQAFQAIRRRVSKETFTEPKMRQLVASFAPVTWGLILQDEVTKQIQGRMTGLFHGLARQHQFTGRGVPARSETRQVNPEFVDVIRQAIDAEFAAEFEADAFLAENKMDAIFKKETGQNLASANLSDPRLFDLFVYAAYKTFYLEVNNDKTLSMEFTERVGQRIFDHIRKTVDLNISGNPYDIEGVQKTLADIAAYLKQAGYVSDASVYWNDFNLKRWANDGTGRFVYRMVDPVILPSAQRLVREGFLGQHLSSRTLEAALKQYGIMGRETDDFDPNHFGMDGVFEQWDLDIMKTSAATRSEVRNVDLSLAKIAFEKKWISESSWKNIQEWAKPEYRIMHTEMDAQFKAAAEDPKAWTKVEDAWYTDVKIGTAGMRGTLGVGTNRINKITLGRLHFTHALMTASDQYNPLIQNIFDPSKQKKAMVIGGDGREGSYDPQGLNLDDGEYKVALEQPGWIVKLRAMTAISQGVRAYVYRLPVSTPQVAYSTHTLDVDAVDHQGYKIVTGAMDTASHNPSDNNGDKPYQWHGAQGAGDFSTLLGSFVPEATVSKMAELSYDGINILENLDAAFQRAVQKGDAVWIGGKEDPYKADEQFIESELEEAIHVIDRVFDGRKIDLNTKIVISPLYGTLRHILEQILEIRGLRKENIIWVESTPHPKFPGVKDNKPNPELPSARLVALQKAVEVDAELILWADPDSDRPAVAVKINPGKKAASMDDYRSFNGNEQLALVTDYMIREIKEIAADPKSSENEKAAAIFKLAATINKHFGNSWVASTVVSGDLMKIIARANGVKVVETLVGFKYIGDQVQKRAAIIQKMIGMKESEWSKLSKQSQIELGLAHAEAFLFGGEESLGSLSGQGPHDKDAISGVMWFMELFGRLRKQGLTMVDRMNDIEKTYGVIKERFPMYEISQKTLSKSVGTDLSEKEALEALKSKEGASLLNMLRTNPPKVIAGKKVLAVLDFLSQEAKDADGNLLFDAQSASGFVTPKTAGIPAAFAEALSKIVTPINEIITTENQWQVQGVYSFAHEPVPNGDLQPELLPKEDFIKVLLEDGSVVTFRPSGTEPKAKVYILARGLAQDSEILISWIEKVVADIEQQAAAVVKARFPEKFAARSEVRTELEEDFPEASTVAELGTMFVEFFQRTRLDLSRRDMDVLLEIVSRLGMSPEQLAETVHKTRQSLLATFTVMSSALGRRANIKGMDADAVVKILEDTRLISPISSAARSEVRMQIRDARRLGAGKRFLRGTNVQKGRLSYSQWQTLVTFAGAFLQYQNHDSPLKKGRVVTVETFADGTFVGTLAGMTRSKIILKRTKGQRTFSSRDVRSIEYLSSRSEVRALSPVNYEGLKAALIDLQRVSASPDIRKTAVGMLLDQSRLIRNNLNEMGGGLSAAVREFKPVASEYAEKHFTKQSIGMKMHVQAITEALVVLDGVNLPEGFQPRVGAASQSLKVALSAALGWYHNLLQYGDERILEDAIGQAGDLGGEIIDSLLPLKRAVGEQSAEIIRQKITEWISSLNQIANDQDLFKGQPFQKSAAEVAEKLQRAISRAEVRAKAAANAETVTVTLDAKRTTFPIIRWAYSQGNFDNSAVRAQAIAKAVEVRNWLRQPSGAAVHTSKYLEFNPQTRVLVLVVDGTTRIPVQVLSGQSGDVEYYGMKLHIIRGDRTVQITTEVPDFVQRLEVGKPAGSMLIQRPAATAPVRPSAAGRAEVRSGENASETLAAKLFQLAEATWEVDAGTVQVDQAMVQAFRETISQTTARDLPALDSVQQQLEKAATKTYVEWPSLVTHYGTTLKDIVTPQIKLLSKVSIAAQRAAAVGEPPRPSAAGRAEVRLENVKSEVGSVKRNQNVDTSLFGSTLNITVGRLASVSNSLLPAGYQVLSRAEARLVAMDSASRVGLDTNVVLGVTSKFAFDQGGLLAMPSIANGAAVIMLDSARSELRQKQIQAVAAINGRLDRLGREPYLTAATPLEFAEKLAGLRSRSEARGRPGQVLFYTPDDSLDQVTALKKAAKLSRSELRLINSAQFHTLMGIAQVSQSTLGDFVARLVATDHMVDRAA